MNFNLSIIIMLCGIIPLVILLMGVKNIIDAKGIVYAKWFVLAIVLSIVLMVISPFLETEESLILGIVEMVFEFIPLLFFTIGFLQITKDLQ